jgi:hypothetical protein
VVITGLSPNGFNGSYVVASIPSENSFTVSNTTIGSASGTGTITVEVVNIAGGGGAAFYNSAVGGYGGLANGGPGLTGGGGGGTQTAGGAPVAVSLAGSVLLGGQGITNSGADTPGGGGGYFGGGGGSSWGGSGGGGGSSYLSNITVISSGESTSGRFAPGTSNSFYVSGVGNGGISSSSGGNGLVAITAGVVFSLSEAMRIHSNGYLGVGTAAPVTQLDVSGGLTVRNGFRPLYMNVSGTSLTVPANAFGTHYNITNSGFSSLTLPTINWSNDSNGYWVFRNNTSSYLSTTVTYTSAGTTAPTNPVVIPPANSTTIMVTYPGASTSNYVLF